MQQQTASQLARRACAFAAAAAFSGMAWSAPEPPAAAGPAAAPPAAAGPAAAPLEAPSPPPAAKPKPAEATADTGRLEAARGGTDTVTNNAKLDGVVTGNVAINVNTGANIIGANAFSNMSGIPIVIQNSGANVLIQNSTIINLQFR